MMRRPALSILAILACAGAVGCAHLAAAVGPDLRVLVYNMHAGLDAEGANNIERVAALIREQRADIVLLQEVDRHTMRSGQVDQLAQLARLTGLRAAFGKTLDYQGGQYGIGVLSRFPIRSDTLISLPVTPPQARAGGSYEPRGVLYVVLEAPGGDVHVFNTHLDASTGDEYRLQEIATVLTNADRGRGANARVLVGGDLNATPESAVIGRATAAGWRDAFAACGSGEGLTYPAHAPVKRIDYLLLTPQWRCRAAEVITTNASDHRPLLVRLAPAAL